MAATTAKPKNPDFLNPRLKCGENGVWVIHYSVKGEGRYHSRRISTGQTGRREAEAWLQGLIDGEDVTAAVVATPTIADLIAPYQSFLRVNRPHAETQHRSLKFLLQSFGAVRATALTDEKIHAHMIRRGVSGPTMRRELSVLHAVYTYAEKTKRIRRDDVPHIDMPRQSNPRNVFLNEEQEADFFAKALAFGNGPRLSRVARFVALALCTAARRSAILELRWSQVDLVSGLIDYRISGGEAHNKKRAVVPISNRLLPILRRAYDERQSDFVLDSAKNLRDEWKNFVEGAGYEWVHAHDLRRTWCSLALQNGADLMGVSQVMGDDPATIAKHYAQFASDGMRKAVNIRG